MKQIMFPKLSWRLWKKKLNRLSSLENIMIKIYLKLLKKEVGWYTLIHESKTAFDYFNPTLPKPFGPCILLGWDKTAPIAINPVWHGTWSACRPSKMGLLVYICCHSTSKFCWHQQKSAKISIAKGSISPKQKQLFCVF